MWFFAHISAVVLFRQKTRIPTYCQFCIHLFLCAVTLKTVFLKVYKSQINSLIKDKSYFLTPTKWFEYKDWTCRVLSEEKKQDLNCITF